MRAGLSTNSETGIGEALGSLPRRADGPFAKLLILMSERSARGSREPLLTGITPERGSREPPNPGIPPKEVSESLLTRVYHPERHIHHLIHPGIPPRVAYTPYVHQGILPREAYTLLHTRVYHPGRLYTPVTHPGIPPREAGRHIHHCYTHREVYPGRYHYTHTGRHTRVGGSREPLYGD